MLAVSGLLLLERFTNAYIAALAGVALASTFVVGLRTESVILLLVVTLVVVGGAISTGLLGAARGMVSQRAVMTLIALFLLPHLALPVAQRAGLWMFHDSFEAFAHDAQAGRLPRTETFRIGPYTYDQVCAARNGVVIWNSGDDFMAVPALRISADGTIKRISLRESSQSTFRCAHEGPVSR